MKEFDEQQADDDDDDDDDEQNPTGISFFIGRNSTHLCGRPALRRLLGFLGRDEGGGGIVTALLLLLETRGTTRTVRKT